MRADVLALVSAPAHAKGLRMEATHHNVPDWLCGDPTRLRQALLGLVGFVGLVAPHLVERLAPGPHGPLLWLSAGMGAALLLWADVLSRTLIAPQELPVGVVTSVLGGVYLCVLIRQRGLR